MSRDYRKLHDKLTDAFIEYQYRLDNPFPHPTETRATMEANYCNNPLFHAKVTRMVAGVTHIVTDWLEQADEA